ncbi:hypothetical protein ES703_66368 [subsurface metagenome]
MYCSSDIKPSAPLCKGMNTRGLAEERALDTPLSIIKGVSLSIASSGLSGCRYISSIMPRVPLRVSPSTSKGAKLPPLRNIGNPVSTTALSQARQASLHFIASSPALKRVSNEARMSGMPYSRTKLLILPISITLENGKSLLKGSSTPIIRGK